MTAASDDDTTILADLAPPEWGSLSWELKRVVKLEAVRE
jgi:hypothetical protein